MKIKQITRMSIEQKKNQQAATIHSKLFLNLIKNNVVILKTRRIVRHLALIYRAVNAKVSPSST